jgi:Flavodoxin
MTRILVAYYSLTGYTRTLAEELARQGGEDSELLEVVPAKPYTYFSAGVKGVTQAMSGVVVDLSSPVPAAGSFDALAVLSPTWGWMSSPPVRSFVAQLPAGEGRPAVAGVTHAGGPIGSFERLAKLVTERGYHVVATLSVFCYDREAIAAAARDAAAALALPRPPS